MTLLLKEVEKSFLLSKFKFFKFVKFANDNSVESDTFAAEDLLLRNGSSRRNTTSLIRHHIDVKTTSCVYKEKYIVSILVGSDT